MSAKHHRHVALTEPLLRFVEQEVAEVRYAYASEDVWACLRLLLERKEVRPPLTGDDGPRHG
jgi:antitoxin ParD1/3/4